MVLLGGTCWERPRRIVHVSDHEMATRATLIFSLTVEDAKFRKICPATGPNGPGQNKQTRQPRLATRVQAYKPVVFNDIANCVVPLREAGYWILVSLETSRIAMRHVECIP